VAWEVAQQVFVPTRITWPAAQEADIRTATVHMCAVDWGMYRREPSMTPMFKDLVTASFCNSKAESSFVTTFGELEDEFGRRGCSPAGHFRLGAPGCVPTGLVMHQSRVGSTLAANMLNALPTSLVYSEAGPPVEVLLDGLLSDEDRVRALRVVVAAMGRPIAAAALSGVAPAGTVGWTPRHLYLKFQSAAVHALALLRTSFPETPWIFMHREPVEIMASLLRNARVLPRPDAPLTASVSVTDRGVADAPCMRTRGEAASPFVRAVLGTLTTAELLTIPPEAFCAAVLAEMAAAALTQGAAARAAALAPILPTLPALAAALPPGYDYVDGAALAAAVAAVPARELAAAGLGYDAAAGLLYNASTRTATLGRTGLAAMVEYADMPEVMVGLVKAHFGPRPVSVLFDAAVPLDNAAGVAALVPHPAPRTVVDTITPAVAAAMRDTAVMYSKARGRTGEGLPPAAAGVPQRAGPLRGPALDGEGAFTGDSEEKQARAWPSLKAAAAKFLAPLRLYLARFNAAPATEAAAAALHDDEVADNTAQWAAAEAAAAELKGAPVPMPPPPPAAAAATPDGRWPPYLPAALARRLPIGGGYPYGYPLVDILRDWNADVVSLPASYGRYQSMRVFDYATEAAEAAEYRAAEVPFVLRNLPRMGDTVERWADDAHMEAIMGRTTKYVADVNDDNHFMFFNKGLARHEPNFEAPTTETTVTYHDWVARAREVAAEVMAEEAAQLPAGWAAPAAAQVVGSGINDAGLVRAPLLPLAPLTAAAAALAAADSSSSSGKDAAAVVAGPPERPARTLWYMKASTNAGKAFDNKWIADAFPVFDPEHRSFTMVEPSQQRGIHCRFGMPGIIAESHYDAGRNFVFMTRGRKRYILSAPDQCDNLAMLRKGPSARHSWVDWTDPAAIAALANATAFEVVLEPGEALYLPSFWFHFIVSLTVNIQCNSRSGTPPHGADDIAACGFDARYTEDAGVHTALELPLRHLMAEAAAGVDFKAAPVIPARRLLAVASAIARSHPAAPVRAAAAQGVVPSFWQRGGLPTAAAGGALPVLPPMSAPAVTNNNNPVLGMFGIRRSGGFISGGSKGFSGAAVSGGDGGAVVSGSGGDGVAHGGATGAGVLHLKPGVANPSSSGLLVTALSVALFALGTCVVTSVARRWRAGMTAALTAGPSSSGAGSGAGSGGSGGGSGAGGAAGGDCEHGGGGGDGALSPSAHRRSPQLPATDSGDEASGAAGSSSSSSAAGASSTALRRR